MTFKKLSHGVQFQEIFILYSSILERFCPTRLFRPVQLLLTFTLFHVYLLYAVVFSITKLFIHHTRVKGSRIIPLIPSVALCKEKMIMFVTSLFVFHWFSRSVLGISAGWEYISSWVFNFRQINIKPQLKLVSATDSCHSCHSNKSNMSIDLEEVNADVNVFVSPENKQLAEMMKDFQRASDTASFASDLVSSVAASITQSDSLDSLLGFSSSGEVAEEDEVDIDAEMDKACLLEAHSSDTSESALEAAEEDPLLGQKSAEEQSQHLLTLKEVAKEQLFEVSKTSSGFRSRIPRAQALERFRRRNAIANSQLRERFLTRNRSSSEEYSGLLDSSEC